MILLGAAATFIVALSWQVTGYDDRKAAWEDRRAELNQAIDDIVIPPIPNQQGGTTKCHMKMSLVPSTTVRTCLYSK